jgi:predicted NBD/HSP70 family sugar kinase
MRSPAIGLRSESVRRANLSAIVRELHTNGPRSRSMLVRRIGLTRSAIRSLLGELLEADLVREGPAELHGTPGRPSPVVRPNPEAMVVLAIEVNVDTLAAAVVGLGGEVLELVRVDRSTGSASVEATIDEVVQLMRRLLTDPDRRDALIGVGVAVAGVVRRSDGFVSMAPNLRWRDVPFGQRLNEALGLSVPVTVANEADLGALAEHLRGVAVGHDHVLFVAGAVGVGGGLIVDGRPLNGVAGYAGEIGHMPINRSGRRCGCGAIGCWETEVGEGVLLARAGHPADGGREALDAVLAEAAAGSPVALAALDETGSWLGLGLAGLVNLLNPELVVLGGRFARIHPYVAASIEAELDRHALAAPRALVRIVPARLAGDASLIGAAELAFEATLADPAGWMRRSGHVELASA